MIKRLLNFFGYYKLDQLQVGGHCGICGKFCPKEIVTLDDGGWTLCEDH